MYAHIQDRCVSNHVHLQTRICTAHPVVSRSMHTTKYTQVHADQLTENQVRRDLTKVTWRFRSRAGHITCHLCKPCLSSSFSAVPDYKSSGLENVSCCFLLICYTNLSEHKWVDFFFFHIDKVLHRTGFQSVTLSVSLVGHSKISHITCRM